MITLIVHLNLTGPSITEETEASGHVCEEFSRLREVRRGNLLSAMLFQKDQAIGAGVSMPL